MFAETVTITVQEPSCCYGKLTVLVDIYSSYTACRHMHATTFSVVFTYPTLTRRKMLRVVSADMKNRSIALSYLYR